MSDASELVSGALIGGRYELINLIGEGGMGQVWRARQINLDREIALKLLVASDFESVEEARRRFSREAHVASAIKHPNVIEVYDVGEHGELTYLAMELLRGLSLRDRLANGELLSIEFVIDQALDLCSALRVAHAAGAVHRDLKPENIFLDNSGQELRAVILDFGLAFIDKHEQHGRMTQFGVVMGTPHYISPEQARGREVGPAADVYSLACVLYEMLAGTPLFEGSPLNVMTQHLYVSPDPLSERRSQTPRELEELIMAMLRKRPQERPSVEQVLQQLQLLAGTLSGRRQRARDSSFLDARAERMISFSPTAPLPAASSARTSGLTPAEIDLHVAVDTEVSEELDLGLVSNEIGLLEWAGEGPPPEGAEMILVLETTGEAGLERVRAAVATGLPVVAALASDDRQTMGELARAGATELTTMPLMIDNLVRALRRAKRRHERNKRRQRSKEQ